MEERKTPPPAKVIPINPEVALRMRNAPALASVNAPLDEGLTCATHTLHKASILLLAGESRESAVRNFTMSTEDKGTFFDIGLYQKYGDINIPGTKNIMLVAIDPAGKEVLLLDWNGKKVTLKEGGEGVPIGSGKFLLRLERIEAEKADHPCDREPIQRMEEIEFMAAHTDDEWKRKYDELW
jgi:hypothetical protein